MYINKNMCKLAGSSNEHSSIEIQDIYTQVGGGYRF